MNAPVSPAPAPPPARPAAPSAGCLPCLVFLLVVVCAGGMLVLRKGWLLPKEEAGQAVIEIMGSPTREQMKAHVKRMTSGEFMKRVFANVNLRNGVPENVEVRATGPFITITARADFDQRMAVALANATANAYDEDLQSQYAGVQRRTNQAIEAFTNHKQGEVETARLSWMEMMKKYRLSADGRSPADEAAVAEIAPRLAKAKADLLLVNLRAATLKEQDLNKVAAAILANRTEETGLKNDCQHYLQLKATAGSAPDGAAKLETERKELAAKVEAHRAATNNEAQAMRAEVSSYENALQDLDKAAFDRLNRRSEMDQAKVIYDSQKAMLNRLREEAMERRVKDSIVQMHTRFIEPAHVVEVPNPNARKIARFTVIGSAVLLVAFLLSAFAGRLSRRA